MPVAERSLLNVTWLRRDSLENLTFTVVHDRSLDVVLQDGRGEGFVKDVFSAVCPACRSSHAKATPLLLDIGANTGFYTMLAGAYGCSAVAFDAQPGMLAIKGTW